MRGALGLHNPPVGRGESTRKDSYGMLVLDEGQH